MSKTYAQLAREIAALQAFAQKQLAIESKDAVAKINDMIAKYSLSAGDLKFASSVVAPVKSATPAKAAKGKGKGKSATVAKRAQYSDGKGNVWGGRGPRPGWLRTAIAAGRAIESFLTGAVSAPAAQPSVAAVPAKKVSAQTVAVKSAAAKRVVGKPVASAKKVSAKPTPSGTVGAGMTKAKAPIGRKSGATSAKTAVAAVPPHVPVKKTASKKVTARKVAVAKSVQSPAPKKAAVAKKSMPAAKTSQTASTGHKISAAVLASVPAPEASTPVTV